MLHLQGKHAEANHHYEEAATVLRASGMAKDAAMIEKQQVDALTHLGRYGDALARARAARRVLAGTDPIQLGQLEMNVGNVYYLMDRYRTALKHYNRAREALSKRGDARMRALVDISCANIFTEMDQPDEALRLFASARRTSERAGQHLLAALARYYAAYIEFLRGRYNTALRDYYDARDRLATLGSIHYVAWCELEIRVINASWGGRWYATDRPVQEAIDFAVGVKGVVMVVSAGNSNRNVENHGTQLPVLAYPASNEKVITVAA